MENYVFAYCLLCMYVFHSATLNQSWSPLWANLGQGNTDASEGCKVGDTGGGGGFKGWRDGGGGISKVGPDSTSRSGADDTDGVGGSRKLTVGLSWQHRAVRFSADW